MMKLATNLAQECRFFLGVSTCKKSERSQRSQLVILEYCRAYWLSIWDVGRKELGIKTHQDQETVLEESKTNLQKWLHILRYNFVSRGVWHGLTWLFELFRRLIIGAPLRKFSQVTPNIFVGGQYRRRGLAILKSWGITSVVNMRSEYDDAEADIAPEYYLHLPTVDGTPPSIQQLLQGVEFIEGELEAGRTVYIHCESGVGRAVTMAAAYLVSQKDLSPIEAWKALRKVRPFIRPTMSQKNQLERFSAQGV